MSMAFSLRPYQLANGDYGDRVMYDITAKVPADTTREQFDLMLRNLLIQRFKLKYHYEKKDMLTYELVLAKGGLKMKLSPPDTGPPTGGGMHGGPDGAKWTANKISMERIVGMLSAQIGGPVTDSTGLKGTYDIVLTWKGTNRTAAANSDDPAPTLEEPIQDQLGLKLEPKKAQVDVFVIDHAEKNPSEN